MKVLFYSVKGAGHVNPTLPVVRALVEAGHEVLYSLTEEWAEKVEATGATFSNIVGSGPFTTQNYHPTAEFLFQLIPATAGVAPRLVEEARVFQPDVVLHDSAAPWGHVVGRTLGCPTIVSLTTLVMGVDAMARLGFDGISDDPVNLKASNELQERFGLRLDWENPAAWMWGEDTLSYSCAALNPAAATLPARFHFVGSAFAEIDADRELADQDLEHIKSAPRLVYVAMGTVAAGALGLGAAFFQPFIDGIADDADAHLLIACGQPIDPEDFGPLPDNVTVRRSVPQVAVLHHADAFVTHAGANSMHEGLLLGVPLVCVPCFADQPFNAQRIEEVGAGVTLPRKGLNAGLIRAAIDRVTAPDAHCAEASAKVGEELRAAGGVPRAVEVIEAIAGKGAKA
jgi:MGT family glycosyltransferase